MRTAFTLGTLAILLTLAGCTHISGVVEQLPGRPLTTAVISIGRPDGIAVYGVHHVDSHGRFDFQLGPADESDVYAYDASADPRLTLRRIDRHELGTNMKIEMRPANPDADNGPINP